MMSVAPPGGNGTISRMVFLMSGALRAQSLKPKSSVPNKSDRRKELNEGLIGKEALD
jgi:hypothetical protein